MSQSNEPAARARRGSQQPRPPPRRALIGSFFAIAACSLAPTATNALSVSMGPDARRLLQEQRDRQQANPPAHTSGEGPPALLEVDVDSQNRRSAGDVHGVLERSFLVGSLLQDGEDSGGGDWQRGVAGAREEEEEEEEWIGSEAWLASENPDADGPYYPGLDENWLELASQFRDETDDSFVEVWKNATKTKTTKTSTNATTNKTNTSTTSSGNGSTTWHKNVGLFLRDCMAMGFRFSFSQTASGSFWRFSVSHAALCGASTG